MCRSVCLVLLHKAYVHVDNCCEAMHAFVGVCVWACTGHMPTAIASRQCMLRGSVWLVWYKAHTHCDCCEALHVCACLMCACE